MKNQPEFALQKAVCQYLNAQFPNVLFMSDTVANIRLNMGQKMRNKSIQKSGFHCPDVIIFEPRGKFHGLFIELKVVSPFKKDGQLKKDEHIENKAKTILQLGNLGYCASFAVGFEMAKDIIDNYMNTVQH